MSPAPRTARDAPSGPPVARPPVDGRSVSSHSALVSVSVALVGALSYAGTLLLVHLLDAPSYSDYAAALMLLGIVGVLAEALVPLPLTHVVRGHPRGSEERRRGMAFAWSVSLACGVLAAVATGAVTAAFAPPTVVAAVAVSALALFLISPVSGWLQGELRFVRYGLLNVLEVTTRLLVGVGAVLLGWGAGGAIAGFVVGVLVVLLAVPRALRGDLGWRPGVVRERTRWAETMDIALVQLVVATLVGADVVVVALLDAPATESAGYQALSTLAKGSVYVAAGAAVVAFPLLRSLHARVDSILTATMRTFGLLAFPAAAVLATAPPDLLLLVVPERYADSLRLLPLLAAAGIGYAALTMFATVLLGLRAYRRCQLALLLAVVLLPAGMVLGWRVAGLGGLATGVALGALAAAGAMWGTAAPLLPRGTLVRALRGLLAAAALVALLAAARPLPLLWTIAVALAGAGVLALVRQQPGPADGATGPAPAGGAAPEVGVPPLPTDER